MKRLFLFIFCFITLITSAQEEKRLALVIGNANYEKGALKNPVNDAALIKQTLEELDFEVIYATNLENKRSMVDKIAEFGRNRSNFDVGFVYYAGHGIQVDGENYLLPTKETFESEYDVEDYGVSVQKIMRYITGMSQQVNVLILDACRDNPFESYWNKSRSIKGSGLAKIPPPTGSLIAFSTSSNTTASDGDEVNSFYCKSLSNNLKLENTSIDQVFRNVRSDVIKATNGRQTPEEASKLVGDAFYLKKVEDTKVVSIDQKLLNSFKKLDEFESYLNSIELSIIHNYDPKNKDIIPIWENFNSISNYSKGYNDDLYFLSLIGLMKTSSLAWMVSSGSNDLESTSNGIIQQKYISSMIELKNILTSKSKKQIESILNNSKIIKHNYEDVMFRTHLSTFFAFIMAVQTYDDINEIDKNLRIVNCINYLTKNYNNFNDSQKLLTKHVFSLFNNLHLVLLNLGYEEIEHEKLEFYFDIEEKHIELKNKIKILLSDADFNFFSDYYNIDFSPEYMFQKISSTFAEIDYHYISVDKNEFFDPKSYDFSYGMNQVSYNRVMIGKYEILIRRLLSFIDYHDVLNKDKSIKDSLSSYISKLNFILIKYITQNNKLIEYQSQSSDYFEYELFGPSLNGLLKLNQFFVKDSLKQDFNYKIHQFFIDVNLNRIKYVNTTDNENYTEDFSREDLRSEFEFNKNHHLSSLFRLLYNSKNKFQHYSEFDFKNLRSDLQTYWDSKILDNNRPDTVNDKTFSDYFHFKSLCCELDYAEDLSHRTDCYYQVVKSMNNYDFAIEKQNKPPLISEIWSNYSSILKSSKCKIQGDSLCEFKYHKNIINYFTENLEYYNRVWGTYNNGQCFTNFKRLNNYYIDNLSNYETYNYEFLNQFSKMTDSFLGLVLFTKNNINILEDINGNNIYRTNHYFHILNKILNNNDYDINFKKTLFNINLLKIENFINQNSFPMEMDLSIDKINSKIEIYRKLFFKINRDIGKYQRVKKGMMGMRSINVTDQNEISNHGRVKIIEIVEGYPAFNSGLLSGDYVISLNNLPVNDYFDIIDIGSLLNPGDKLEVVIKRKNKLKNFELVLQ